ncbi:MAG: CARDB domain-containing protein [Victivallaceae bacterium]|jgi:hypothetical protein
MKKTLCRMTVLLMAVCLAATSALAMPSYNDVLLVVNSNSSESQDIGAYFKAARNLPDTNVCSINVKAGVDSARMSHDEELSALSTIKNHLIKNGLTDKINYIVVTRGIPYWSYTGIKGPFQWGGAEIDGYHLFDVFLMYQLSNAASDSKLDNIFNNNPYFYYNNDADKLNKKFSKTKFGYYIVGRLDGPGAITIKNMIDSTGALAYESYKKQANGKMKLLTLAPYYDQTFADEINSRGNIEVVSPNPLPPDVWNPDTKTTTLVDIATPAAGQIKTTFDKVGKDVMFSYLNDVAWSSFFPWPKGNSYYADADFVDEYPFIYRGATFLPGSIMMVYRSFPAAYMSHTGVGGLYKMNISTKAKIDYRKTDGSDIDFRHTTCAAYDPVNSQVWCGTGANQFDVGINFDTRCTDDAHRETMRNYGGGIAIYAAATGNIISYINANDAGSPLKNNAVMKMVYDKNSRYMWVAHYKGIQYYDFTAKTWNDIPALQNDYAAMADICLDPFDSDKVYFAFYYNGANGNTRKVSSQIAGADTSIFEYSKSAKTVTPYVIDAVNNKGILPKMAKTSANTIWVSKGTTLYRYDLSAKSVVETIDLATVIPEMVTLPVNGSTVTLDTPRHLVSPAAGIAIASVGCNLTYTKDLLDTMPGSTYQKKNYLVRIVETTPPSTVTTINTNTMNAVSTAAPNYKVRDIVADPASNGKTLYMAVSEPGRILSSTDGAGAVWKDFSNDYSAFSQVKGLTLDGNGYLYAVGGYRMSQNNAADFQAFGLCAWGGGMSHDAMEYLAPQPYAYFSGSGHPYYTGEGSWSSSMGYRGSSQMEPMMFMLLDGFYMGEARLSVFKGYPAEGSGGHTGHMLVFEPKCAPFAPRVNEAMLPANPQVANKATLDIPILSPGLPWHMNDLTMESVNKDTVKITDETGAVFTPSKYEFIKPAGPDEAGKVTGTGTLRISGNFDSGIVYSVKLICGVNGIKNIKGASLTNTRTTEFKDDITLYFGNGVDISKGTYVPPDAVTGPQKMPLSNSKIDLVVNKVWLAAAPVTGKPLTVKFQIRNVGTVKTNGGTIVANVYWNNILVGSVTHGDLAAGAVSADLSFLLDAQYVIVGRTNTIMVMADGTGKVSEMRETNNTGSTTFLIDNKPDLSVKEITLSSTKPGNTTVNFKIANVGFGPTAAGAGAQTAAVYVNNSQVGTVHYDDLAKGAVVALKLDNVTVTAGACRVKVTADSGGIVTEVNEKNNSLERAFIIKK